MVVLAWVTGGVINHLAHEQELGTCSASTPAQLPIQYSSGVAIFEYAQFAIVVTVAVINAKGPTNGSGACARIVRTKINIPVHA